MAEPVLAHRSPSALSPHQNVTQRQIVEDTLILPSPGTGKAEIKNIMSSRLFCFNRRILILHNSATLQPEVIYSGCRQLLVELLRNHHAVSRSPRQVDSIRPAWRNQSAACFGWDQDFHRPSIIQLRHQRYCSAEQLPLAHARPAFSAAFQLGPVRAWDPCILKSAALQSPIRLFTDDAAHHARSIANLGEARHRRTLPSDHRRALRATVSSYSLATTPVLVPDDQTLS